MDSKMKSMEKRASVLLVSVDAMKPEFVFEQERLGISLPNITRFMTEQGLTAREGMKSVFPTFTYPCHESMITGTNPAVHGTVNNAIFDPTGVHMGAWHWFATKQVKTLWEAAKEAGYCSATVAFPTSIGAKGDYVAPEFWWDGSELDATFIDAMSFPQGLVREMEKEIGPYPGGLDTTDEGDRQRGKAALWMLRHKLEPLIQEKPFFLSAYFASLDESIHKYGVYSPEAKASLEKIDQSLGLLFEEAKRITGDHVYICLVSDHGAMDNTHNLCPNVLLKQAGLIETDEKGRITDWKAYCQRAGGTAEIRLKDPQDHQTAQIVEGIVKGLLEDKNSGIMEVLTREQAVARGSFPKAAYVLLAEKGYELRNDVEGEYFRSQPSQKGQHGYSEEFPEMRASFMLTGPGIQKGTIENVKLIDVAPTLAGLMGASLPQAEGRDLLKK